jgi:hypothetical protein
MHHTNTLGFFVIAGLQFGQCRHLMCESRGRCFLWFRLTDRSRITDIGSSWVVNGYLNKRFKQEKKKYKHYTVTSLVTLSVSTLEQLMKDTGGAPVLKCVQEDKQLNPPFEAASAYGAKLLVLLEFVILHATYSNKHYVAFWLLLIPFLILGKKGVSLFRVAIVSPSATHSSTAPLLLPLLTKFPGFPLHISCRTGAFPPKTAIQSEVRVLLPNRQVGDGGF